MSFPIAYEYHAPQKNWEDGEVTLQHSLTITRESDGKSSQQYGLWWFMFGLETVHLHFTTVNRICSVKCGGSAQFGEPFSDPQKHLKSWKPTSTLMGSNYRFLVSQWMIRGRCCAFFHNDHHCFVFFVENVLIMFSICCATADFAGHACAAAGDLSFASW